MATLLLALIYVAFVSLEITAGLWASSYLVQSRGLSASSAARAGSLFYLGLTASRFFTGFIADRAEDKRLMRYGYIFALAGMALLCLPVKSAALPLSGLVIIGLGCAPVYPAILHATPGNFGKAYSQAIIGLQMAVAYTGFTLIPPVFGFIADRISMDFYPFFLLLFGGVSLLVSERTNQSIARSKTQN